VLAVLVAIGAIGVSAADQDRKSWRDYAGSPDNSRFSTSTEITRTNVATLQLAWNYPYGDTGFNPVVVNGVVYGRGRNGSLIALDARTGEEMWIHDGLLGMTERGVNYWESRDGKDRRLIFALGDYLQEIDAATGKSIPSFGTGGVVDLKIGLGRDPATVGRGSSGTPGKVFENLIILGSAPGEGYFSPPGDLRAYDVVTGRLVWTFHTIPHPGEFGYETWPKDAYKYAGGANTWGEITIDAARGIAYFPTGSPTYDFYGADRIGANLFGDCLIALDARTGKRLWHFQTVHHDLWDYDNTSAPQLTTTRRNGGSVDVVAMASKTGFLYVFNRVTGEPIWPIEERPVPTKTEVPGEEVWPTQPFPTAPPAFARQRFTTADISPELLTPAELQDYTDRIAKARNEGLFTPIGFSETIHMPGNQGGSNWSGTAANPNDGTVYVVGFNIPSLLRLVKPDEPRGGGAGVAAAGRAGRGARGGAAPAEFPPGPVVASGPAAVRPAGTGRAASPFGGGYPEGTDAPSSRFTINGYGTIPTVVKPPYTTLTSYDLNNGTIRWQIGLGDDLRLAARGITGTGTALQLKTGVIPTATGLVFVSSGDNKLRALDAVTGKDLWATSLGAPTQGSPAMYELDGHQYVLVTASETGLRYGRIAGTAPTTGPTGYIAYALPRK
jgi:quinoprotein glucose dehydrogenase